LLLINVQIYVTFSLNVDFSKCYILNKRQFELKPWQNLSEFAMTVAILERIRREKNRDAELFRSAFFARGNQPLGTKFVLLGTIFVLLGTIFYC
jgi:hypothetical protein